ncbi:putative ABC transport system permease protein [Ekhidna lutea]|uniref:Putative ABC transport system permease protein n=1 Tax=Ekhidna lutea TaxID=447679 RepID=A0A239IPM3_EKHLU|nr:ABC transporter permease [Ekhidna lutea]SNS95511.1 putative ABC transport system permease protein [Ekhidna lutea]
MNELPSSVKFLCRALFNERVREEIIGDLNEEMEDFSTKHGKFRTKLHLLITTLMFTRYRYTWKNINQLNTSTMFIKHTLRPAWRNLKKDKMSAVLNGIGLTIGFTLSLIIALMVIRELSYDQWHEKSDRIFKVTHDERSIGRSDRHLATVGPPVGPALVEAYDEIENYMRVRDTPTQPVKVGNKNFYEDGIFYIDSTLFNMFDYSLAEGDERAALKNTNSVVLSADMAEKYFGSSSAVGQRIEISETPYIVTGVMNPSPSTSHFTFDFIIPFHAFRVPFGYPVTLNSWGWISFHTYIELKDPSEKEALEEQLVDFMKVHWPEEQHNLFRFVLQPLEDIYLGEIKNDIVASGSWNNIYALSITGALLLFLIIFNYTNLSVGQSLTRTKEVGVRKALGASKRMVVFQFAIESVILSLLSFIISIALILPTINFLESYLGISIYAMEVWQSNQWLAIVATILVVIVGAMGGAYPAFIMSKTKAIAALARTISGGQLGINVRKVLVTMQFIITIGLLAGSIIIYQQISYIQDKDLGYDKSALAVLRVPGQSLLQKADVLKNQLNSIQRVSGVAIGGGRMDGDNGNVPVKTPDMEESKPIFIDGVDYGYFEMLGIPMVAGREFDKSYPTDSAGAVIINEKAVRYMGYSSPEEAIGRQIQVGQIRTGNIVGVVADYHFSSLHNDIGPLAIMYPRTLQEDVYIRVEPGNMLELVEEIEAKWSSIFPDLPFDLIFLENHLNSLYQEDVAFAKMFQALTIVTLIIACLGLYGLISLIATQKTKEISVRKVLGANLKDLMGNLFRPFALRIVIAMLIVSPIAYVLLSGWLDNYAYKIDISWWLFLAAGLVVLVTALVATVLHSMKVYRINPARTLKDE